MERPYCSVVKFGEFVQVILRENTLPGQKVEIVLQFGQ
jgi:hypothetical protein